MPRVRRTAAERAARLRLPACGAEQEIVDAVRGADVVVLSGATGSGKSTQVPQFLYEAGLCGPRGLRVVATQPRRVAVVATAERVARELGAADPGAARDALVAYRTRYDRGGLGPATRLVFETDGVLLRELERDLLLRDYGAAVVDEAHERSLTTDLLLGLLGRSVALRRAEFERARAAGQGVGAPVRRVRARPADVGDDELRRGRPGARLPEPLQAVRARDAPRRHGARHQPRLHRRHRGVDGPA